MQDLDIKALNGYLNIETRNDGGIGLYYETDNAPHNTLMLDKKQMLVLAGWLISRIEKEKK